MDFAAHEFVEISYRFGLLLGQYRTSKDPDVLQRSLSSLLEHSHAVGLRITHEQLLSMVLEITKDHPQSVDLAKLQTERWLDIKATPDINRLMHHIELLYSTMLAEMKSISFRAIPPDRSRFCDPKWLSDTDIPNKFPTSLIELQRAGDCYSIGQPTAAVFHSMRALESGLTALANEFKISAAQSNWQTIIEQIEAEIRKLGTQQKSQQKLDDEKFYGSAAAHLYFVKNAWRNHVAHMRESYSDGEALKILQNTYQYIESLCPRLRET